MDNKISIVIPAYLPSQSYYSFLDYAIESIYKQTYKNFVITIVFNGPFFKNYNNVQSIVLPHKTSAAVARNIGASLNWNSDYLCFLDADDAFVEHKLETQLQTCNNENLDFCFTDSKIIDENNTVLGKYKINSLAYENEEIKKILPYENVLITSTSMIKTTSFFKAGMFVAANEYGIKDPSTQKNEYGNYFEDYYLWITAINNFKFKKIQQDLCLYRKNTSVER